jgi:hypothetical protein
MVVRTDELEEEDPGAASRCSSSTPASWLKSPGSGEVGNEDVDTAMLFMDGMRLPADACSVPKVRVSARS